MPRTLVGETVYGNACSLNGTSQYFTRSSISSATDNLTVSAWIKKTALTTTGRIFQTGQNDANGYEIRVNATTGLLNADFAFVANYSSGQNLSAGIWYHVVLRRSSGTWQFFLNGSSVGGTSSSSPNAHGANTTIGASRNSGGTASGFFDGLIDDVRFYSRALSDSEITDLYNQGANPSIVVSSSSLQGHWKLDESSGNAADSSGNGRTMTNTGTATYTTGIVAISSVPDRTNIGTARTIIPVARTLITP